MIRIFIEQRPPPVRPALLASASRKRASDFILVRSNAA
jgi:hypothetical protein